MPSIVTSDGDGLGVGAAREHGADHAASPPRSPAKRSSSGSVDGHVRRRELVLLGRPLGDLELARHREEEAVRVDLGGVRAQGVVPLRRSTREHSMRVVTSRSGISRAWRESSQSPNGDSRPAATIASCTARIRASEKPWL